MDCQSEYDRVCGFVDTPLGTQYLVGRMIKWYVLLQVGLGGHGLPGHGGHVGRSFLGLTATKKRSSMMYVCYVSQGWRDLTISRCVGCNSPRQVIIVRYILLDISGLTAS